MTSDYEEHKANRRRTKSVTRAEEITQLEARVRKSQPDRPCHRPRDSLFSWSSDFSNFTGFINWGFLLLFMGGIRLLLENLLKYGIRVDPEQWLIVLTGRQEGGPEHPSIILILYSVVPVALCLVIEKGIASDILTSGIGIPAHVINLLVLVLMPMFVIHIKSSGFSLIGATTVCFLYSILFLKLWSYVQVNSWCRIKYHEYSSKSHLRRQSVSYSKLCNGTSSNNNEKDSAQEIHLVQYPHNLNFRDIYFFICAPTLCYELNFPRTDRIRKRFLLKRLFEVVILLQVIMSLFQQWIIPSVKHSLIPFSNMEVAKATERLLKLAEVRNRLFCCWAIISFFIPLKEEFLETLLRQCAKFHSGFGDIVIPNHLVWLIFFYLMFHSFLNLLGELLHFADRNFYCDWWNATNIDNFWRNWNMPVHRWAVRHLYLPLVEQGYNKTLASTMVFFISAFFHEYLVSVPLRTFKIWAFMGMMGQIPLSMVCRWVELRFGARWGNLIVWASVILGQPLCIMMYYHDYVITHFGKALIERYGHVN